jgi:hypothetical protein
MAMWDWIVSYMDWDLHWTVLLSSLCKHTHRESSQSWEKLAPKIFSHILHIIDLPVGASHIHIYDNREGSLPASDGYPHFSLGIFVTKGGRSKVLHIVRKAAKLIVYLLPRSGT